ncbi:MAG: VCBS repeat-containing protein [Kiritimatiellae bacterium]|nr:VCBS repeat-containing protein [Kiritimatiellia bacterium]
MNMSVRKCAAWSGVLFALFHAPRSSQAVDPELWWQPPIMGATAFAAAMGDVNGDGHVDAAWVHLLDPGSILLNDGTGRFSPHPTATNLPTAAAVAMGDLNGNGHLDLLLGRSLSQCQVWTNNGNGDFFFTGHWVGPNTQRRSVALADVNGNGYLDAILPSESSTKASEVWTNDGAGFFTFAQTTGTNANRNVAIGDINGNGYPDLVFAANLENTVWTNDGNGVFYDTGQTVGSGAGSASYGIDLGDLNGDGSLDVFIANFSSQPNEVWLNDGSGTFTNSGQALGSDSSFCVVLLPVNNDPYLDAVVGNAAGQTNSIWLNDGNGYFSVGPTNLGLANAFDIQAADLDHDTDIDYFISVNANPSEVWLRVPVAEGGPLKDSGQRLGGHQVLEAVPADFNGDGSLDIAFGAGGQMIGLLTNNGVGQFSPTPQRAFQGANIGALDTLDYNGDDFPDLVVGLDQGVTSSMFNRIWLNDGSGSFTSGPLLSTDRATRDLAVADLTGNGHPDIVEVNRTTAPLPSINPTNRVYINQGNGTWTSFDGLGGGWSEAVAIGDLNGDNLPDIVVGNQDIPSTIWFNTGATQFVDSGQTLFDNADDVVLADFNGNGALDIFLVSSPNSVVYTNDGSGNFSAVSSNFSTTAFLTHAAAIDLDGNPYPDIWVTTSAGTGAAQDRYYLNDGTGDIALTLPLSPGNDGRAIAVGDFTGDGVADIFSGGGRGDSFVWVREAILGAVEQYAASFGLLGADRLTYADPEGDGVVNILEYAYNLNPAVNDAQVISNLSTATNGLPLIEVVLSNGAPWFVAETIRLVNPVEISYHLDVAPSLMFTGSVNAAVQTIPLNADYERATYQAPAPAGADKAFGRFRVEPEP